MEEKEYKGKRYITDLVVVQLENGWWKATHFVKQYRSVDLEEWEEVSVEASATAETDVKAIKDATVTMVSYMQATNGDLFNAQPPVDKSRLN